MDLREQSFINILKNSAKIFNDSPNFNDKDILSFWHKNLYKYADQIVPILKQASILFKRWPSIRELLEEAQIAPATRSDTIRQAVNSIWAHMAGSGNLTPLGKKVFDSFGGMHKLGQAQFDTYNRSIYNSQFYDRAKQLINEPDVPLLTEGEKQQEKTEAQKAIELEIQKTNEEIKARHSKRGGLLYVEESYEDRKRKALEAGLDYWEPPRSWEIGNRDFTDEERRLWVEKIRRNMKSKGLKPL